MNTPKYANSKSNLNLNYLAIATLLVCAACGGNVNPPAQPQPEPPAQPAPWTGDTLLAPILNVPTLGRAQLQVSDTLASRLADFDKRVAAVAIDSTAPALVRSNAILLLSDRRVRDIEVFTEAMLARDDRVRASAIVALRPFIGTWKLGVAIAKSALNDPSALVQSKALEMIGDSEPDVLREYARRTADATLRQIALDLVQVAEDRGAALVPKDTSALLERVTPSGHTLRYRPTKRWEKLTATAGELWLGAPGQQPTLISGGVEVVNHVLPAFISTDGKYLVYEADRQIRVRDIAAGSDRVAGAGIAPRLLPFAQAFIFLRQKDVQQTRGGSTVRYDVVRASFTDANEKVLGQVSTNTKQDVQGNYSPARWLRIRENDGVFHLTGDLVAPFRLPDPFAGS
jgi:hypothetical protein